MLQKKKKKKQVTVNAREIGRTRRNEQEIISRDNRKHVRIRKVVTLRCSDRSIDRRTFSARTFARNRRNNVLSVERFGFISYLLNEQQARHTHTQSISEMFSRQLDLNKL